MTATAFVAVGALTDVVAHAAPGHAIAKPAARPRVEHSSGRTSRAHHRHPRAVPVRRRHVDRPLKSTKPPGSAAPQPTPVAPAPAAAPAPVAAPAPAPAPASAPVSGGS